LDLEGSSLTPILVSLVTKNASMLDAFGKVRPPDPVCMSYKQSFRAGVLALLCFCCVCGASVTYVVQASLN
jgi:hypothetical protein